MVELSRIVSMLEEQRRELLGRLDAVDTAIAALNTVETAVAETRPAEPDVPTEETATAVLQGASNPVGC